MFVPCINDDLITLLSNRCAVSAGYTSTVEHGHNLTPHTSIHVGVILKLILICVEGLKV